MATRTRVNLSASVLDSRQTLERQVDGRGAVRPTHGRRLTRDDGDVLHNQAGSLTWSPGAWRLLRPLDPLEPGLGDGQHVGRFDVLACLGVGAAERGGRAQLGQAGDDALAVGGQDARGVVEDLELANEARGVEAEAHARAAAG